MPVSIKPAPVIKGKHAKRLLEELKNPKDNSEFLKKCAEEAKIFIMKG